MYHPLPIAHGKGMILVYLQIVHHHARYHLPLCNDPNFAISSQKVQPEREVSDREKFLLGGQEGVFLVGMHDLTLRFGSAVMVRLCWRRDGQIHQIIVGLRPHMQDRLQFHLMRLGVVGPHLVPHVKRANGLFSMARRDTLFAKRNL